MHSSGIRRGVAVVAASAMAAAGVVVALPGLAEAAVPGAGTVTLDSQFSGNASTVFDGVDSTVHLVARAGTGVDRLTFQYRKHGSTDAWTEIATVTAVEGVFSDDWAPPSTLLNTHIDLQAVGKTAGGAEVDTAGTDDILVDAVTSAVHVHVPAGGIGVYAGPSRSWDTWQSTSGGLFSQPTWTSTGHSQGGGSQGIVTGTTSSSNGTVSTYSPSSSGPIHSSDAQDYGQASAGIRSFASVVDFRDNPITTAANDPQWVVVAAEDGSDDVEPTTLYRQLVNGETAVVDKSVVASGATATATVTVTDQVGNPVAGALVGQVGIDYNGDDASHTSGAPEQVTDAHGVATFPGLQGRSTGAKYGFYVDTNANGRYDSANEFMREVTVTDYSATSSGITTSTTLPGTATLGEANASSVTVKVTDQKGNPANAADFVYQWSVVPFDGSKTVYGARENGETGTAGGILGIGKKGIPGEATVDFPTLTDSNGHQVAGTYTLNAWLENGTPGEDLADIQAAPLTVEAGHPGIVWDDGSLAQRPQYTTGSFTGRLVLADPGADNAPLAKRGGVALSFATSGTGDASLANNQPAGTVRASSTTAVAGTDSNGAFGVSVFDPTTTKADTADALTASWGGVTKNLRVQFIDNSVRYISGVNPSTNKPGAAVSLTPDTTYGGTAGAPGVPDDIGTIEVDNAQGVPLSNVPVTLSVDNGYLTPLDINGHPQPAAAPSEGDPVGVWKDAGKSLTVKTDVNGRISGYAIAIGRDAGFDDDGQVTTTLTATAADQSTSAKTTWSVANPLNGGKVTLGFAEDQGDAGSRILPKAATGLDVLLDLGVTDQFGNPIAKGQSVTLTSTGTGSAVEPTTSAAGQVTATSTAAVDQVVTGSWRAHSQVWHNTGTATSPVWVSRAGTDTVSGESPKIDWYAVDPARSTYTLDHDGGNRQPVGSLVTEVFTATDEFGQPMAGYRVDFFRDGPDSFGNGEVAESHDTNVDGQATYTFQAARKGKAALSALLYDGSTAVADRSDTVWFGPKAPKRKRVKVRLSGHNTRNGSDRLNVRTSKRARGAQVTVLFRSHGTTYLAGTTRINRHGRAHYVALDSNGKARTRYVVKISRTDHTKAARSHWVRVR